MKYVELNPKGNFDPWDDCKIKELRAKKMNQPTTDYLKYEDDAIRLWIIALEPYERLPFQKFKDSFSIICISDGLAISRFMDSTISLLKFNEKDTCYQEVEGSGIVFDLENIGKEILKIAVLEHKSLLQ